MKMNNVQLYTGQPVLCKRGNSRIALQINFAQAKIGSRIEGETDVAALRKKPPT
jgi:hypothetical protein